MKHRSTSRTSPPAWGGRLSKARHTGARRLCTPSASNPRVPRTRKHRKRPAALAGFGGANRAFEFYKRAILCYGLRSPLETANGPQTECGDSSLKSSLICDCRDSHSDNVHTKLKTVASVFYSEKHPCMGRPTVFEVGDHPCQVPRKVCPRFELLCELRVVGGISFQRFRGVVYIHPSRFHEKQSG